MKFLNINKQIFIDVILCPLVFFLICLAITSFKPEAPLLFQYDKVAIQHGEWWRFLSAHFTHSTWNHFFLNMTGLIIMSYLFSQVATWWRWLTIIIFASLFCSTCFYIFQGPDYIYVGMSDALHGVIIAYAMLDYRNFKLGSSILIAGTIAKVIWEKTPWYVEASAQLIGGRVATESHFYGTIAGLLIGFLFLFLERKKHAISMQSGN